MRPSLTLSHNLVTSFSANCLQLIKFSIQPSRVGIAACSERGGSCDGSGALLTSMSIFESMIASSLDKELERYEVEGSRLRRAVKKSGEVSGKELREVMASTTTLAN